MTRPRQVLPNQYYLITRRCTQRQFLLRPDEEINNAVAYCLSVASDRYKIDVLISTVESNHHHTVIFDRHGNCPRFLEHFHKLVARSVNAKRGRWENLWAAEEPCVTRLLDDETVLEKLAYAAANPVKDRLVERAVQWPGLNGYLHLKTNKPIRARRPRHFFRAGGTMPEEVTLQFVIPPELGSRDEVVVDLISRVEDIERTTKAERAKTGARVFGARQICRQRWQDSPTSEAPHRNLRPRFAGKRDSRVRALVAFKEFLAAYREARRCWIGGASAVFPVGTYWLAFFTPLAAARGADLLS